MNKKILISIIIVSVFTFAYFWENNRKEILINNETERVEEMEQLEAVNDNVLYNEVAANYKASSSKTLVTEKYNSCGEAIPVLLPGFISKINGSTVSISINQAGYNEEKEVRVNEETNIYEIISGVEYEGEPGKAISFDNLEVGSNIVMSAITGPDGTLYAEEIKHLIFQ